MNTATDIRVLGTDAKPTRITRRELAQTLLAGLAAEILSPLSSAAHPLRKHLLNGSLLDFADAHLSAAAGEPLFLSAGQLTALDVLSEAIIPGSRKAQCASFIDLLLSADTHEVQKKFLASLSAMEANSQGAYHAGIVELSPTQRNGLLAQVSTPGSAGYKHFNHLKDWMAGAYYSSEIGMRELGWKPDRVFPSFPGCSHADGHS
jgi:hypothetical protein